jgi:hypothetical protein
MEKTEIFQIGPVRVSVAPDNTVPAHPAIVVSTDDKARKDLREAALQLVYEAVSNATIWIDGANDRWTYRHHSHFKPGDMLGDSSNPLDAAHPSDDVQDIAHVILQRCRHLSEQSNIETTLQTKARELQENQAQQGYATAHEPAPDGHEIDTRCNMLYLMPPVRRI